MLSAHSTSIARINPAQRHHPSTPILSKDVSQNASIPSRVIHNFHPDNLVQPQTQNRSILSKEAFPLLLDRAHFKLKIPSSPISTLMVSLPRALLSRPHAHLSCLVTRLMTASATHFYPLLSPRQLQPVLQGRPRRVSVRLILLFPSMKGILTLLSHTGSVFNPLSWWRAWRANWRKGFESYDQAGGVGIQWGESHLEQGNGLSASAEPHHYKHRRAARQTRQTAGKHRPRLAGDGENLPLEIVRCMSEWLSVLEARGTVGGSQKIKSMIKRIVRADGQSYVGNALGGLYGCVSSYEDILSGVSFDSSSIFDTEYHTILSQFWREYWLPLCPSASSHIFFVPILNSTQRLFRPHQACFRKFLRVGVFWPSSGFIYFLDSES